TVTPVTNSTTTIHLGDQVSATLPGPGDTDQYSFTLQQATTVLVTPQGGNANVSLYGTGYYPLVTFNSGTGQYAVLRLDAGTYSFNVTGTGSSTPSYAFSMTDLVANAVDAGNSGTVTGAAPAQRGVGVYQLETIPGATYNLDFATPALTDNADALNYSLVDVAGRVLANITGTNVQSVTFTGPQFGSVYLVVRQVNASATATSFTATVRQPVTASTPLSWGTQTTATFQTRQDQIAYGFTQTQAGWVELQGITAPLPGVEYDIVGANGSVITQRTGFGASAPGSNWDVYLAAGQYFIRIDANADGAIGGVAQFTAVQVPASQQIARQGGVAQTLQLPDSANTLSLWTLDAQAGDTLNLTSQTWPGTGTVQILTPNGGSTIATWNPSTGPLNITLSQPGTYLLRVTSNPLSGATANGFKLT